MLSSGRALAYSSSRCIANDASQQNLVGAVQTEAIYLQVKIFTYKKGNNANSTSQWVKGSDLKSIADLAGVSISNNWIANTKYLCMVGGKPPIGSTDYVAGNIYDSGTSPRAPFESELTELSGSYYTVNVDASGNIIGVGSYIKTGSGGAVHLSCWSSFF